jgi:hypothetical protein
MYQFNRLGLRTVDTVLADCQEILYEDRVGGRYAIPAGSNIVSITWYDASTPGGTFYASYDADGVQLVQTVSAEKSYEIPPSLAGAAALKAVGSHDGQIDVYLKG